MARYEEADLLKAVDQVVEAIKDPGVNPEYHYRMIDNLHIHWPVLAKSLDNLVKIHGGLNGQR